MDKVALVININEHIMSKLPINYKKVPYYIALSSLTAGASLILGFLSFGGMYALIPILPLAFATFALSVAYEGEVYLQNIKGTLNKLFKSKYLENFLAKEYLLANFPNKSELEKNECPQFFKDYAEQLKLLMTFEQQRLNKQSNKRKKHIEKTLANMEKWFAQQLFATAKEPIKEQSIYSNRLKKWLYEHKQSESKQLLKKRQSAFNYAKAFSVLAALFMGLGSTYLIVEAFTVIPFIAAISFTLWPIMILPMALIAGVAYGMLTYNAITDFINNDTIKTWFNKIRTDVKQRHFFMPIIAVFLFTIAIALTVCTAGTWWTIAKNARPLFTWMSKLPSFVMGVINPMITGLSALIFNSQNIAESLEMVEEATQSNTNLFKRIYKAITEGFAHIRATENWFQLLNPFRLLIKLTITPLRVLLFLGHLVSIAMTSDRMPGVPQILSILVATISEGFEDAHYFVGQDNKNENIDPNDTEAALKAHLEDIPDENGVDIPSRILNFLALPLYALAAAWDHVTSKINQAPASENKPQRKALTLTQAWNKQRGIQEKVDVPLPEKTKNPSKEWHAEHAVSLIEHYEKKHLKNVWIGSTLANEKRNALMQLKDGLRKTASEESIENTLLCAKNNPIYKQHRLFHASKNSKTATQEFIETLGSVTIR